MVEGDVLPCHVNLGMRSGRHSATVPKRSNNIALYCFTPSVLEWSFTHHIVIEHE